MQRFFLALLALSLTTGSVLAADTWSTFRDPAGVFIADTPQVPTLTTTSITNTDGRAVPMLEYLVDRGSSAMLMIVSDLTAYPDANADKVIQGAVGGAEQNAVQVVSDTPLSLDGNSGRKLVIQDKDGNVITDQIFFVNLRLYQAMSVLPPGADAALTADAQRFADSFHFISR